MNKEEACEIMRSVDSLLDKLINKSNAGIKKEHKFNPGDLVTFHNSHNQQVVGPITYVDAAYATIDYITNIGIRNIRKVVSFQVEGETGAFVPGKWVKLGSKTGILLYNEVNRPESWFVAFPEEGYCCYHFKSKLELL